MLKCKSIYNTAPVLMPKFTLSIKKNLFKFYYIYFNLVLIYPDFTYTFDNHLLVIGYDIIQIIIGLSVSARIVILCIPNFV